MSRRADARAADVVHIVACGCGTDSQPATNDTNCKPDESLWASEGLAAPAHHAVVTVTVQCRATPTPTVATSTQLTDIQRNRRRGRGEAHALARVHAGQGSRTMLAMPSSARPHTAASAEPRLRAP